MLAEFCSDFQSLERLWRSQIPALSQQFKGVVLALSGGVDSMVLFDLFVRFSKEKINFNLAVCHTNFGLRGKESDEDQIFIERAASEAGIPCFVNRVSKESRENRREKNIQIWARTKRYQHFEQFSQKGWVIALAHHSDDLSENALLRLARGTSPGSIAGMHPWSPPFWRPLLGFRKELLLDWADRHDLRYRHDSSNDKLNYSRNIIRHEVLPILNRLYPGASERIARCAIQASEMGTFCSLSLKTKIERAREGGIPVIEILEERQGVGFHLLSQALGCLSAGRKALSHRFLSLVWSSLEAARDENSNHVICLPASDGKIEIKNRFFKIVSKATEKQRGEHTATR